MTAVFYFNHYTEVNLINPGLNIGEQNAKSVKLTQIFMVNQ